MIEVKHLCKTFGSVKAINNLSLNIDHGIAGLVGENGSGKSTLLRLIAGVEYPDAGTILINSHEARSVEAKKDLFFLNDDPYAPKGTDLDSLYDFYSRFYPIDHEKYLSLINQLDLPFKQKINTFSKGMKRQAFFALCLAINVSTFLLDEAFDGLDPLVLEYIKSEMLLLADQNKTIVVSSHNISVVERLVDKTFIIHKGIIAKDGTQEHFGEELVKYQIVSSQPLGEATIGSFGGKVVSLKKVGSIYYLVMLRNDQVVNRFKETIKPIIMEAVPMDSEELVLQEMMLAKKEGQYHE